MTIELLQNLSLVSYVLAGISLFISIVLFFRWNIINVIGDFTGANERKAIENMRQQNENGGENGYHSMKSPSSRSSLTDKISPSGRLLHRTGGFSTSPGTEKFSTVELTPRASETTVLSAGGNETTVLSPGMNETTVLSPGMNETTVLSPSMNETTVLSPGMNETTVLSQGTLNFGVTTELTQNDVASSVEPAYVQNALDFSLEIEMCFLGSTELIE